MSIYYETYFIVVPIKIYFELWNEVPKRPTRRQFIARPAIMVSNGHDWFIMYAFGKTRCVCIVPNMDSRALLERRELSLKVVSG